MLAQRKSVPWCHGRREPMLAPVGSRCADTAGIVTRRLGHWCAFMAVAWRHCFMTVGNLRDDLHLMLRRNRRHQSGIAHHRGKQDAEADEEGDGVSQGHGVIMSSAVMLTQPTSGCIESMTGSLQTVLAQRSPQPLRSAERVRAGGRIADVTCRALVHFTKAFLLSPLACRAA